MQLLSLHHYGFLTADTKTWLQENELLLGKPFKVFDAINISTQKVRITFVEQFAKAHTCLAIATTHRPFG
jgi:hypothetical protein